MLVGLLLHVSVIFYAVGINSMLCALARDHWYLDCPHGHCRNIVNEQMRDLMRERDAMPDFVFWVAEPHPSNGLKKGPPCDKDLESRVFIHSASLSGMIFFQTIYTLSLS